MFGCVCVCLRVCECLCVCMLGPVCVSKWRLFGVVLYTSPTPRAHPLFSLFFLQVFPLVRVSVCACASGVYFYLCLRVLCLCWLYCRFLLLYSMLKVHSCSSQKSFGRASSSTTSAKRRGSRQYMAARSSPTRQVVFGQPSPAVLSAKP